MNSSSDSEGYNSDEIDSEIEVSLYGAIHHDLDPNYGNSDQLNNNLDSHNNNNNNQTISDKTNAKCVESSLSTEELISKSEIAIDFKNVNNSNNNIVKNKRKIECIQIDDSSEGSDVVIISNNNEKNAKPKISKKKIKLKKKSEIESDISLANVSNLRESTLLEMDKFYNEDLHDSDEEMQTIKNMSNDSNDWKVSYNDILLSRKKSNRYYKNRLICHNCSERGHQARDCPLPKKSPTCFLCGLSGHKNEKCKSVLCSKCLSPNHKTAKCNILVDQLVCDECGVRGHVWNQCTNNWRKYHLTTSADSEPICSNLKMNKRVTCYNCGAFGKHFGHECRSAKVNNYQYHTRPSPLMDSSKKGRCFNERQRNRSHHSSNNGNISSNELSSRSASFDRTLSEFDLSADSIGSIGSFNGKNKHIKWIYPETNGIGILRNNQKDAFEETILNDSSAIFHKEMPLFCDSAQTHQQINNSMLEKSQTTPKRSKRKNRHKRNVERHELLKETNISLNQIKLKKIKQKKIRRRINRRLNKKLSHIRNKESLKTECVNI